MDEFILNQLRERFRYDPNLGEIQSKYRMDRDGKFAAVGHFSTRGYVVLCIMGKTIAAHRVAWFLTHGAWPPKDLDIDHINGIKHDNRLANLRLVSRSANLQNRKNAWSKKTNSLLGAYFIAQRKQKPWRAALKVMGKTMSMGQFATEEEAHAAYLDAKRIYHADFVP